MTATESDLNLSKLRQFYLIATLEKGWRILDIGTADGTLVGGLSKEVSDGIVRYDRWFEKQPGGGYEIGDAGDLPFADGEFNAVLMCDILEHLANPRRALAEARRVGKMLIGIVPLESATAPEVRHGFPVVHYTPESLVALLAETGWEARSIIVSGIGGFTHAFFRAVNSYRQPFDEARFQKVAFEAVLDTRTREVVTLNLPQSAFAEMSVLHSAAKLFIDTAALVHSSKMTERGAPP